MFSQNALFNIKELYSKNPSANSTVPARMILTKHFITLSLHANSLTGTATYRLSFSKVYAIKI